MLTLSTKITLVRIALIPCILMTLWWGKWYPALAFFLLACFTDVLDGFIARQYQQETQLGAVLDTVADKLLFLSLLSVVIFLPYSPYISPELFASNTGVFLVPFWYVLFFMARELLVVLGALAFMYAAPDTMTIRPSVVAKAAGFLRCFFIACVLASYIITGIPYALCFLRALWAFSLYGSVILELCACAQYLGVALRYLRRVR